MDSEDPLNLFLPPVGQWFRAALGMPTPAQQRGWPAIAAGKHTLILAPTGSGKTLAAFLACLDCLWRQETLTPGVRVLYISPLKALNNDIHRNLQAPLEGVAETARAMGLTLPTIEAAVRTGDTPTAERQRLLRRPPHLLITTPESLHLLLTSRARETLRGVTHCIIDEIHALCPNKRGVFLALLLERLMALNPNGFVRIGLSATQRPLEEVARYLGGQEFAEDGGCKPRPVTVVDGGLRKDLDLRVVSPVEHFGFQPERSIWPSIYRLLEREIEQHRSTIVFANDRRAVERITACLNENASFSREQLSNDVASDSTNAPIAHAHHGSVALEVRQQTEQALKEGRLAAVVATASLELGIDMGAVELVCQVESPGSVARGLQRVGRAGHIVGQKSKGRLIPKTLGDLLEQAVLAREMAAGRVEALQVPVNCLDVLAQQVIALTAMDVWEVPAMYSLLRQAYPFRDLTPAAFDAVLEMVTGRYRLDLLTTAAERGRDDKAKGGPPMSALTARVSWDRVHNRLLPLPGTQQLALLNGGTIPDTGQYAAYTSGGVRIGELDEEFIFERRVGDSFLLGTNAWRIDRIEADRVLVVPAEGAPAIIPFWRGEGGGRTFDLGKAIGTFLRELAERIDREDCLAWLETDYFCDRHAARNLRHYVQRQLLGTGSLPTDRTLVVEASRDPLGDWQVLLLSPYGGRLHLALRLALEHRLGQRLGYRPQCLHHNDGILIRLSDTDEPLLDLLEGITPDNVESLILDELADSALFALRFRQNAARAMLLPRGQPGKRAPLWLQRLRGRDLLQVARKHPDFPIVAETFRECLHDYLDVPRLQTLLRDVRRGEVQLVTRRADAPSPFGSGLLFSFTMAQMYELDRVDIEPGRSASVDSRLLDQLVAPTNREHLLDPRAIHQVERRLRGLGQPPRTATEQAEWLRRLGDLAISDLEGPMAGFLAELETDGRAKRLTLPGGREPERWILTEEEPVYRSAFGLDGGAASESQAAAETILTRYLATHALVGLSDILDRYPFERIWAERKLKEWSKSGKLILASGGGNPPENTPDHSPSSHDERFALPSNLEQVQRGSLALARNEVLTCPPPQFADFLLRWQGVHPSSRRGSAGGLAETLTRLQGLPLPADLWEAVVLPARVPEYQPRWLDEQIAGGGWVWVCETPPRTAIAEDGEVLAPARRRTQGPPALAFWERETIIQLQGPVPTPETPALDEAAERVLEQLQGRGASFVVDLAQQTGLTPAIVRSALWTLLRRRLVTNDHFDVIRRGEAAMQPATDRPLAGSPGLSALRRRGPSSPRRSQAPEGRWSLIAWGRPEAEAQAVFLAMVLLHRYGVVARELANVDPWMPPWRVLYEVLTRLELAGEVRRGYFVEGLSGAQFALPEAADQLQDTALPSTAAAPVILLHSQDPANLYGSGAPFDIPLLDGGTRPLLRRPGNWLLLRAGRPLLIVEQQGKKLTALPSASRADVLAAVAQLPGILTGDRMQNQRHKLSVAEWNGQPVTGTPGREILEAAGFVRDLQEMTLYAGWR